jgi:hypothetical protein
MSALCKQSAGETFTGDEFTDMIPQKRCMSELALNFAWALQMRELRSNEQF